MFLHSLLEDRLLVDKPGTHILKKFKVQTSRALVSGLVNYLNEPATDDVALLSTSAHVLWSMELIGHSFSCPIEDEKIIDSALELYARWMFSTTRPVPIRDNEDAFLKEMFQHMSMLFAPRKGYSGAELRTHTALCTKALEMYSAVARQLGKRLSADGWECLVKVVLGICDHLLKGPADGAHLGNSLETLLLRVLFDVWLRSGIVDPQLWRTFAKFAGRWVHRRAFLTEWRHTAFALTRKLLRLLYDPGTASDPLSIRWSDHYTTIVVVNDKTLVYTWHQLLHLIGNPSKINEPDTHLIAVQGLAEISECFLTVGSSNAPLRKLKGGKGHVRFPTTAPNGNFVLNAFGPWLFDVALMALPGFEEGRATAMGALCRLFVAPTGHDWNAEYLSLFYRAVITALSSQPTDSIVVLAIISNCEHLFTRELAGSFILVQHLLPHFRYILSNAFDVEIRRACLTMLASMLSLATHCHTKYGPGNTIAATTKLASTITGSVSSPPIAAPKPAAAAAAAANSSVSPGAPTRPLPPVPGGPPERKVPPPPVPPRATSPPVQPPAPATTPPTAFASAPASAASSSAGSSNPNSPAPNSGANGLIPTGAALAAEPDTKPRRAEREAEMSLEVHLRGVAMTLINALISEHDVLNLEMILWLIGIHLREETLNPTMRGAGAVGSSSFANLALRTVWASMSQANWPTKVSLTALHMLSGVSDLHATIHAQNDTTIPEFVINLTACIDANLHTVKDATAGAASAATSTSANLRPGLRALMNDGERASTTSALMSAALHCLHMWVSAAPWIMRDGYLAQRVLACVCGGLRKADDNIHNTSLITLKYLLYDIGLHPNAPTPSIPVDPVTGLPSFPSASPAFPAAQPAGSSLTGHALAAGQVQPAAALPSLVPSLSRVYSPSSSLSSPLAIALRLSPVLAYSSPLTEQAVLSHLIARGRISRDATVATHVRYFLVNARSLVSMVECDAEAHARSTECVWFLRDMTGKYVWRTLHKLRPDTRRARVAVDGAATAAAADQKTGTTTAAAPAGPNAQPPTSTLSPAATAEALAALNSAPFVNVGDEPDDRLADAMRAVLSPPLPPAPTPAAPGVAAAPLSPSPSSPAAPAPAPSPSPDPEKTENDEFQQNQTVLRSGQIDKMREVWTHSKTAGMLDAVHSTARWIGVQQSKATHTSYFTAIDVQTANEQSRLEHLQPLPTNTLFPAPTHRPRTKKAVRAIDAHAPPTSSGVPFIRLALSTMGLLTHLAPLPSSMPFHTQPLLEALLPGKDLMDEFAALDAIPDREVYTIAVLLRRTGQHTIEEMCRNPLMSFPGAAPNPNVGASAPNTPTGGGAVPPPPPPPSSPTAGGGGSPTSSGGAAAAGAATEPAPPGFLSFLRGLGSPLRADQPELEFHVPTLMSSVAVERRSEFIVHDAVRVVWSEERTNFRLDDPQRRTKAGRSVPRKRRAMVYIVVWPLRSGLFRVRVHTRGLQQHPSLDAKLASFGVVVDPPVSSAYGGASGSGAGGGSGGSGAGPGGSMSSASRSKPHHHSAASSGGSGGGSGAGGASGGSGGTGAGPGGVAAADAAVLDDSKLRNAPTLNARNPRLARNGLTPYWVRSVSNPVTAQQVFDEWRESVTNERAVIGPLGVADMCVNAASLCQMVRDTCVAATRLLNQLEHGVTNPFQPRLTTLKRVAKQYTNPMPPAHFYHALFLNAV